MTTTQRDTDYYIDTARRLAELAPPNDAPPNDAPTRLTTSTNYEHEQIPSHRQYHMTTTQRNTDYIDTALRLADLAPPNNAPPTAPPD